MAPKMPSKILLPVPHQVWAPRQALVKNCASRPTFLPVFPAESMAGICFTHHSGPHSALPVWAVLSPHWHAALHPTPFPYLLSPKPSLHFLTEPDRWGQLVL